VLEGYCLSPSLPSWFVLSKPLRSVRYIYPCAVFFFFFFFLVFYKISLTPNGWSIFHNSFVVQLKNSLLLNLISIYIYIYIAPTRLIKKWGCPYYSKICCTNNHINIFRHLTCWPAGMLSFVEGHHLLNKHIQIFWDINIEQNIINFQEEKYSKRRIRVTLFCIYSISANRSSFWLIYR
jgi:hypothetical protein